MSSRVRTTPHCFASWGRRHNMSQNDIPVMFRWETPWRPIEIEELQANLGLACGRTREINTAMGYMLGQAIKTYRSDPERWISYSRNKNWYHEPWRQQYFPVCATYGGMVGAVDQLAATGAIEHRKGLRGNLGQQSSFRATPDLYRAYTERPVPLICTPRERIILRDGDGRLAPYQNSRDTDRWRKQVLRFNEALSSTSIELDGKLISEGDAVWVRDEDGDDRMVNGTATLSLHRVWNENWQRNGRLYGCWVQNLPKENRRTLLLNGEPVAEPDYPALHCGLIYDLAGKPMPDKPFEIDGFERSEVKRAFYTMVNAPSWDSARRAIWQHSPRWKELMPAIAQKHSAVKEALCSGIGARLMCIDATIMCRNLTDLNREGIIALPIHDSVIVQAKYEGRAFEIMERNLASGPQHSEKSAHKSASQVLDKLPKKEAPDLIPDLIPDLHNGHSGAGRVVVVVSPPVPSWVVSLPSDLAALAVVAWFYAGREVAGRYSAPALTCSEKCLEKLQGGWE
jgi:hypothetical protein